MRSDLIHFLFRVFVCKQKILWRIIQNVKIHDSLSIYWNECYLHLYLIRFCFEKQNNKTTRTNDKFNTDD